MSVGKLPSAALRAASVAALTLAGCSPPGLAPATSVAPGTATVVETAPPVASIAPGERFPSGSRVVVRSGAAEVDLSAGLDAAGAPSVRFDGAKVLFVGRDAPGARFAAFECGPRGEDRRAIVRAEGDCGGAAHLPDGRIVYSAVTADDAPDGAVQAGVADAWALFVAPGDGTPGVRITWGGCDVDPCVLFDGRVLFASWRPGAPSADASMHGVVAAEHAPPLGVATTAPQRGRFVLCTVHPDGSGVAPFRVEDVSSLRPRQLPSLDVAFLRIGDGGAVTTAVASWDVPSRLADGAVTADGAIVLAPRPRPQGHLSSMKSDRAWATLVAIDARIGGRGSSVRVRSGDRVLGDVPLAADGSFHARVPADRPLRLEVIDAAGQTLGAERSAFWLRGGETRVCVRCHDDAETGPPNVRPLALGDEPADLAQSAEAGR